MFLEASKAKLVALNREIMATNNDQKAGFLISLLEKKLRNSNFSPEQQHKILVFTDIIINVVMVVALVGILRTFVMSPFQVYGISMCNTLNYIDEKCIDSYGDYIIINKATYLKLPGWTVGTPQRGDIVVFRPPQNDHEFFIKRVIGLPGESVKLIDGYVYIFNEKHPNGVKLEEPYLSGENLGSTFATGGIDQFKVPEGEYFVLGDNRKRSSDSRLCFKESTGSPSCGEKGITPYLKPAVIEGKAALVLWPQPRVLDGHIYPEADK